MILVESGLELMPGYGIMERGANQATGLTTAHVVKVLLLVETKLGLRH